jgi:WS/DGAT/MGAT family acyltransferase
LAAPVWADDAHFDIANHVLPLEGRRPIDTDDLPELVAALMRGRLDRSRPLWSLHVAELNDGGAALIWRIHHCMADGTAALRLGARLLWDSEQDTTDVIAATDWNPRPIPGRWQLFIAGARDRLRMLARSRPPVLRVPVEGGPKRVIATIRRELSLGKSRSPFDVEWLSTERAVAFASASLSELKRIGRDVGNGATVNDVLLALIAGGLRYWMAVEGRPSISLKAMVPVSLHDDDQLANRDSFFFVELPLAEADAAKRLRLIHDATSLRKSHHDARALDAVFGGRSRVPIPMERFLERRAEDPRVAALCVSNVPGPRAPIFVAGAPVRELYSVAEIGERHALRVSALSLAGILSVGFCAEPTAVPHLKIMVEGVNRELLSLRGRAGTGAASGG